MLWLNYLHFALSGILFLFFALFAISSIRERKGRAAMISIPAAVLIAGLSLVIYYIAKSLMPVLIIYNGLIILTGLLYFLPIGARRPIRIGTITERVDERDIIFAREEYSPGSDKYKTYYRANPDKKATDDRIRALPEILHPGGKYYDEKEAREADSIFEAIEGMLDDVDGEVNPDRAAIDTETITDEIKELTLRLGADEVGVANLNPMYVYSHVGRGPEEWGAPIENSHKYAIMFTLEMDYTHVEAAPKIPITHESAFEYLRGAGISIALAKYIRALCFPARAHISGSNYQIMLPPVAYDAGLGELGRLGYLISPRFGPRVRLGAVTTDLPLVPDRPISFGVQEFCEKCLKCAVNCPSAAIPEGDKIDVRGVGKWPLNIEQCIYYWRLIGTDCGLCMKVCPYSHPPTLVHNLVRAGIKRSAFARTVSVWADDLFYGRKVKY